MRNKRLFRFVALFLAFQTLYAAFIPAISYALTSGPVSPETSSFEPVDTTDMVSLLTGDFTYNLPLLEVPGPAGGYPLSLSYHAGIMPNEEASWVGLGWSLNPGAINRSVNGYADDNFNVKRKVKDYWDGGETFSTTYMAGISIPKTGISFGANHVVSQDTYRGFSAKSGFNVSIDPLELGGNVLHANSPKVPGGNNGQRKGSPVGGFLISTSRLLPTSIGASINSEGQSQSYGTIGAHTFGQRNGNNTIGMRSENILNGTIPAQFGPISGQFGMSKDYMRYWSDATSGVNTFGTLYPREANQYIESDSYGASYMEYNFYAFDSYNLYNLEESKQSDPVKQLGGSLPAYDQYTVLGQGIGGEIKPFIFENGDLYKQSIYERYETEDYKNGTSNLDDPIVKYKSSKKFKKSKVDFRFLNDFSNKLLIEPSELDPTNFSATDHTILTNEEGFDGAEESQHLAGSRHIEWFSNEEISNNQAKSMGFVEYFQEGERKLAYDVIEDYLQPEMVLPSFCENYVGNAPNYIPNGATAGSFTRDHYPTKDEKGNTLEYEENDYIYTNCSKPFFKSLSPRSVDLSKKIGGFMVTNESGVTYHYALPVYTYNEYTRSKVKDPEKGASTFREYKNDEPYAYTWLLTAVTGPDYVDKKGNGLSDDDLGYWVKFDYGLWSDSYQWRTPHEGFKSDIEDEVEVFSYGIKELYYLDAIETKTHKAFFVKSIRKDSRGVTSRLEGGSKPRKYTIPVRDYIPIQGGYSYSARGKLNYQVSPVATLKLDEIYLMRKDRLEAGDFRKDAGLRHTVGGINSPYTFAYTGDRVDNGVAFVPNAPRQEEGVLKDGDELNVKYHNGDLVLDADDISENRQELKSRALRVIELETDYSLAGTGRLGVPNSFANINDFPEYFGGCSRGEETETPFPLNPPEQNCFLDICSLVDFGEEVSFYRRDPLFYYSDRKGTCQEARENFVGHQLNYLNLGKLTLTAVKMLGKGGVDLLPPVRFGYNGNNNPVYANKTDVWNNYKSDYKDYGGLGGTRRQTTASKEEIDAWSLSSITNSLGATINIEYESDSYKEAVLNPKTILSVSDLVASTTENKVQVFFSERGLDINDYFAKGESLEMKYLIVDRVVLSDCAVNGRSVLTESNMEVVSRQRDPHYITDLQIEQVIEPNFDTDDESLLGSGKPGLVINSSELYNALSRRTEERNCGQGKVPAEITPFFISGFATTTKKSPSFGGGLRVKEIEVVDNISAQSAKTSYDYSNPTTGESTGFTAYEPFVQANVKFPGREDADIFDPENEEEEEKEMGIGLLKYIFRPATMAINIFDPKSEDNQYDKEKLEKIRNAFELEINKPFRQILALASELPSPGVLYEFVKVKKTLNEREFPTYSVYQFEVFSDELVRLEKLSDDLGGRGGRESRIKNLAVKNFNSRLGNLKKETLYRTSDDAVLADKVNTYLHDEVEQEEFEEALAEFDHQGVVQQAFHEYKEVKDLDGYLKEKGTVIKKSDYPSILVKSVTSDYKTGVATITENLAFDFYSGSVIKNKTSDSYGNTFISQTEPGYRNYTSMGLKIFEPTNKHMLSQNSATYSYKVSPENHERKLGLVTASTQTWSNQIAVIDEGTQEGIWRKHAAYQWNGQEELNDDGTYSYEDFERHPFDFSDLAQNDSWQQTGEITLYDVHSHALEAKDINGNSAASHTDPTHAQILVSAANAGFYEIGFSGAEYPMNELKDGDVSLGEGTASSARSHTGRFSLQVAFNSEGFNHTLRSSQANLDKKYKASVWVYLPGASETAVHISGAQLYYRVNGEEFEAHPVIQKNKSKSWYLIELDIDPRGAEEVFVGCRNESPRTIYFDDFRFHPINAALTSYVYDPGSGELTHILDENNIYTRFEYNGMGQLVRTSREMMNFDYGEGNESFRADQVLNEVIYHYGGGQN